MIWVKKKNKGRCTFIKLLKKTWINYYSEEWAREEFMLKNWTVLHLSPRPDSNLLQNL